ncbi:MAG: xanthine dehydrogenase family protein molybdopterin-binding subunit [Chloroflexi bacterium]|nr:xanthine dehydrogenase family protein molybdopterin-binding subunit [Chloroflexota bacterium]
MASSPAPAFTVVGKPLRRVEGADKVSGRARYTADHEPPGTLWAKNVRSPLPHARIVSIDTSRAKQVPGVRAVITAADIPDTLTGRNIKDLPLLCTDVVRYVGDRVAVVAADDRHAAEEGAAAVDVRYEELPAVFDPIEAMEPGAPLLHADPRSYTGFPVDVRPEMTNVCGYATWDRGDMEAGFAEADVVLEHTFVTQLAHQGYLEPSAYLIQITEPTGGRPERIEVWSSVKVPYGTRKELARLLERPVEDILMHAVTIGADFGGKGGVGDLAAGYYLARSLGRPIKFVNTASEDLTAAAPKHAIHVSMRTGIKRDGKIVAHDAKVVINRGAYTGLNTSPNGLLGGAGRAGNFYDIPNLHIEAFAAYTNRVPCGYMRAPGSPQILFAVESHMNLLAREIGMDPLDFRRRNMPAEKPSGAAHLGNKVLDAAAEAYGWAERATAPRDGGRTLIGHGISLIDRTQGAGEASSALTVNPDGTITAVTAMPDNGTGGLTVVAAITAETFGVPFERVHLVRGDTDTFEIDVESGASRMTNAAGHAVLAAAEEIKEKLSPLAARALGAETAEWVAAEPQPDGSVKPGGWRGGDGRFISLEDLASELVKEGDPAAHAQVTLRTPRSPDPGICAQMAEVEVDAETGQVTLKRMVTAQDVGTIINSLGHQGQIDGSIVQGAGYALMEELVLDHGRITTPNFNDYRMPTIQDIPELTTVNVPDPGMGPFTAKSIGELPHIPTAGAIANAVADAIGAPMLELPLTAERVLAAIRSRG